MYSSILYLFAVLMATCVFAKAETVDCKTVKLSPDVNSNVKVAYRGTSLKNTKLKIAMKEGKTFADILTAQCPIFPQLYLEYKEHDLENSSWTSVQILKKSRRGIALKSSLKAGEVTLPEGHEIGFCKAYDMRFVMNGDKSSVFQFGPYYNVFSDEDINNKLTDDGEEIININYTEENNTVTATWDFICARSLKIFLQEGDKKYEIIANMSNIIANKFNNSIKFTTKPCTQYKLQIESYWTERPKYEDGSLYDGSGTHFVTSPDYQTFGNIQIEPVSKLLSWDFTKYNGTECTANLEYKVTLDNLNGEELLTLKESKQPVMSRKETLNIADEIEKQKGFQMLEKCHSYQIKMNISSMTTKKIFTHPLTTNQDASFSIKEEDQTELIINDSNEITAKIGPCMANAQVLVLDMGNANHKRTGKFLEASPSPSIVQVKQVNGSNKTFNLSDFKKLKPCVSYSIQLVNQDQMDQLETTDNTEFGVSGKAVKVPKIDPVGRPTLQLKGNALSIVDDEQNDRCPIAKYVVKCWEAGTNETSVMESSHDSANISLKDILGFTSNSQYSCQSRIHYGSLSSQSRISSPWTDALSVSFSDSSSSGSSTLGASITLVTFLHFLTLC